MDNALFRAAFLVDPGAPDAGTAPVYVYVALKLRVKRL
jgi:hypothetical protein